MDTRLQLACCKIYIACIGITSRNYYSIDIDILTPEEQDDDWKYWIIVCLLPMFTDKKLEPIIPFIKRIAEKPTKWENTSEVDEVARKLL
ncbi:MULTISPECIES: DUF5071 domain-containing protein [unclassified Clostridioides]